MKKEIKVQLNTFLKEIKQKEKEILNIKSQIEESIAFIIKSNLKKFKYSTRTTILEDKPEDYSTSTYDISTIEIINVLNEEKLNKYTNAMWRHVDDCDDRIYKKIGTNMFIEIDYASQRIFLAFGKFNKNRFEPDFKKAESFIKEHNINISVHKHKPANPEDLIISKILNTEEGKKALVESMMEPTILTKNIER